MKINDNRLLLKVPHTSLDMQLRFSDYAGKDTHVKTWSHPKGFSTSYIYIYLAGKNVTISDGAGYHPDLWIG